MFHFFQKNGRNVLSFKDMFGIAVLNNALPDNGTG